MNSLNSEVEKLKELKEWEKEKLKEAINVKNATDKRLND